MFQHHCALPSFSNPIQTLSFDPTHRNLLILGFSDNTLQFYDVESHQFPAWSKEFCSSLPKRFTEAHDPVLGTAFDPAIAELSSAMDGTLMARYALFWGSTWICKIPLSHPVIGNMSSKKRPRESHKPSAPTTSSGQTEDCRRDFKMITRYRPILFVDFLDAGELVVVERPIVDVLTTLPPAYFKHKYGAS